MFNCITEFVLFYITLKRSQVTVQALR